MDEDMTNICQKQHQTYRVLVLPEEINTNDDIDESLSDPPDAAIATFSAPAGTKETNLNLPSHTILSWNLNSVQY